jgi:TatD DNase family protein
MIDTHAHLDFEDFEKDREEVISRFFANGAKAIINVGVDLERSRKSVELAEKYKNIFASVGFHPDNFSKAEEFSIFNFQFSNKSKIDNVIKELKKIAKHKKVVAIGECGLDYYRITHNMQHITRNMPARFGSRSDSGGEHGAKESDKIKENQKRGFLAQIELARELELPVIVHCREAWDDLFNIISEVIQSSALESKSGFSLPRAEPSEFLKAGLFENSSKPSFPEFVLHCYSGGKKDTEKFLKLPNVYFSFSGNITYPKPLERAEKLTEAVRMIPLDKIMLDSDSPFLAPQAWRGKRNEPSHIKYIADKIAEIKGISVLEIERATDENAIRFFGLDK